MTEGREVRDAGIFERMKVVLGEEGAEKVVREFGGERITVPSRNVLERISLISAIRYHYDHGVKVPELMARFNLCERTILRYLNGKR